MQLSIFDASSLVHSGVKSGESSFKVKDLPLDGVIHALRYIVMKGISLGNTLVCFDSFTDRNQIIGSYKKGRSKFRVSEIGSQLELLKEILDMSGVATLKVDGFEADDLIYSACQQYKGKHSKIAVYSSDKDLAINIEHKVSLYAVSSVGMDINLGNYKNAFGPVEIPLSASTIKKVFFGDGSDTIPVYKHPKAVSNEVLFGEVCKLIRANPQDPFIGHSKEFLMKILNAWNEQLKFFSEDEFKDLMDRVEVLYPRFYESPIPLTNYASDFCQAKGYTLAQFCYIVRLFACCKELGAPQIKQADDSLYELIKRYSKLYHSGGFAFSRGYTPKTETAYAGTGLWVFDID